MTTRTPPLTAARTTAVHEVADRFVTALERGDAAELERLYHPDLRFAVRTAGTEVDRAGALASFRAVLRHLHDVQVQVVDRQLTEHGFLSQQVLAATTPDGTRLSVPMCMVFRLREGRIVRVDEYFDPAAVGAVALLLPGE